MLVNPETNQKIVTVTQDEHSALTGDGVILSKRDEIQEYEIVWSLSENSGDVAQENCEWKEAFNLKFDSVDMINRFQFISNHDWFKEFTLTELRRELAGIISTLAMGLVSSILIETYSNFEKNSFVVKSAKALVKNQSLKNREAIDFLKDVVAAYLYIKLAARDGEHQDNKLIVNDYLGNSMRHAATLKSVASDFDQETFVQNFANGIIKTSFVPSSQQLAA